MQVTFSSLPASATPAPRPWPVASLNVREGEIDALIGLARTVYAAGQTRSALEYAQHAEGLATANRHGLMGREARAFLDRLAGETAPHRPPRSRSADSRMLQAPA